MRIIVLYLLLFLSLKGFSQKFAAVDQDTYDLVESVNFSVYQGDSLVYQGITKNKKATEIPDELSYDRIEFSKKDYRLHTLETDSLNGAVFLTKARIQLEDVVISSNKDERLVLGESNRIVRSKSKNLPQVINSGVIFKNYSRDLNIHQTTFYIDKVKHKTAYKIHFYEVEESLPEENWQSLLFNKKIYSTDTLYLNPKQKNRIEIKHQEAIPFQENTTLFVCIEALYYLDDENKTFTPKLKNRTKLKFQLSDENNYYAKTVHANSGKTSINLSNTNLRIKYDLVNYFYKTPPKAILLTPALQLVATEKR